MSVCLGVLNRHFNHAVRLLDIYELIAVNRVAGIRLGVHREGLPIAPDERLRFINLAVFRVLVQIYGAGGEDGEAKLRIRAGEPFGIFRVAVKRRAII